MNRIIPGWYEYKGFTVRFSGLNGNWIPDPKKKWSVFAGTGLQVKLLASFSNLRTAQSYIRLKIKHPDLHRVGE